MVPSLVMRLLGVGGVPPGENQRAYVWEKRLHGVMIALALIAVVAFYFTELSHDRTLSSIGHALDWLIFLGFSGDLLWMLVLCEHKPRYLLHNWLDVLIVLCSGLALAGAQTAWVAVGRLLRLAMVALLLTRAARPLRTLLTPGGLAYVAALALVVFLAAGGVFYWLEPTVHSYADGVWLAFVTGATIGYGDIVPTSWAARLFAVLLTLVGLTIFSLVTASIAVFFVGEEEKTSRRQMHQDVQHLKQDMARLFSEEEALLRRELHADVRRLREELERLRKEIEHKRNV